MLYFIIVLIILATVYWKLTTRLPPTFPPGPRNPLPIVGDAWALGNDSTKGFARLHKTYGDTVGMFLGPEKAVVMSDADMIKECFARYALSGRQDFKAGLDLRGRLDKGNEGQMPGLVFSRGQVWSEQRRFALRALKDFGVGKAGISEMIKEEVDIVCEEISKRRGQFIEMTKYFNIAVLNVLWRVINGVRLDLEDPKVKAFINMFDRVLKEFASPIVQLSHTMPWLMTLCEMTGISNNRESYSTALSMMDEWIKEHEDTFQENNLRDFIDRYLNKRYQEAGNESSSFHGQNGQLNQKNGLLDLMVAGSDTSSTTLNWCLLFMLKYPDIKRKVQKELDGVFSARNPTYDDHQQTPYTEAVIMEVQRRACITPQALPHFTMEDVKIGQYFIPRGTTVFCNMHEVMNNPKLFPNPREFRPERYLEGGRFVPHPDLWPFGTGKRRCIGENLARAELYTFFAGIVKRFDLVKEDGVDLSLEPVPGIILAPKPFKVMFEPRE